jgi:heterodisulfide reductase subunit C
MTTATTKYQPKEILEIIRANYKQQQQVQSYYWRPLSGI